MPQLIEIPGEGLAEFPDSMSDADIVSAIQRLSPSAPQQRGGGPQGPRVYRTQAQRGEDQARAQQRELAATKNALMAAFPRQESLWDMNLGGAEVSGNITGNILAAMVLNVPREIAGLAGETVARARMAIPGGPDVDPFAARERWSSAVPGFTPSPEAQEVLQQTAGRAAESVNAWAERQSPAVQAALTTARFGGEVAGTIFGGRALMNAGRKVVSPPLLPPEQVLAQRALRSPQSVGAAAAAPDVSAASAPLRQAISEAGRRNRTINSDALGRHLKGDRLPVPVRYTEGQATQNPALLSRERNLRGKHQELADRFNEQNQALADNLRVLRDEAGSEVFTTNRLEHGQRLVDAYLAVDDAANTRIGALYRKLRDAAGGQFPVDAKKLWESASEKLHKALLYEHAPGPEMIQLRRAMEQGSMTFEQFEALRTNLARTMRSTTDGNVKAAAGILRDAMEELPLQGGAARLKPLADQARAAARTRFQALEADPAYKAAVRGTIKPETFVNQYVIRGNPAELKRMVATLAEDPAALQTARVAVLDYLREAAKVDSSGNFASASFNRALQKIDPRLREILDIKTIETLHDLGDVARDVTGAPAGSFVNYSNTYTAAAADRATSVLEGIVNSQTGGIGGTVLRRGAGVYRDKSFVQQALRPGAGLILER